MSELERWDSIKKGDKLFTLERVLGKDGFSLGKFTMPVWKMHEVESTTPKFFVIDGKKHSKDAKGLVGDGKSFYFSGTEYLGFTAPTEPTDLELAEAFSKRLDIIRNASNIMPRLKGIEDMNTAVELGKQIVAANEALSEALKEQEK